LVREDNGLQWRIILPALKANYPALQQAISAHFNKASLFMRAALMCKMQMSNTSNCISYKGNLPAWPQTLGGMQNSRKNLLKWWRNF
jgi:hypothetical protein